MSNSLELLVARLERIAKANQDKFKYSIDLVPTASGVRYDFICTEHYEGHQFVGGSGYFQPDAIVMAENAISQACKEWSYKNIE